MKSIRQIALTAMLTIAAFSAVVYISCNADACANIVCQHQGSCTAGVCTCPTGYEGTDCEILSRAKFIGNYVGTGGCGTNAQYAINVVATTDSVQFTLSNLDNKGLTVLCTITAPNTFNFTATGINSTYSGSGTLTNNQLSIPFQATSKTNGVVTPCSFTGYK